jgi:hypothetical protein
MTAALDRHGECAPAMRPDQHWPDPRWLDPRWLGLRGMERMLAVKWPGLGRPTTN